MHAHTVFRDPRLANLSAEELASLDSLIRSVSWASNEANSSSQPQPCFWRRRAQRFYRIRLLRWIQSTSDDVDVGFVAWLPPKGQLPSRFFQSPAKSPP